jgi:16S rRNA (guanine527-N7)-methyltransferase
VKHPDPRLQVYCDLLAAAPMSLTSIRDPARLWDVQVADALTALPLVRRLAPAAVVDVGSGGGSPGIPIALVSGVAVTLLEATGSKCGFLRDTVAALGAACPVVQDRSEHFGRGEGREAFDLALARALAPPPVAAELCLPLVRTGGHVLLWTAETEIEQLETAAAQVGGTVEETVVVAPNRHLILLAKTSPTPETFPRRAGMANTRPLLRVRSRT